MKIPESNEITWELHNFIMQGGNSIQLVKFRVIKYFSLARQWKKLN